MKFSSAVLVAAGLVGLAAAQDEKESPLLDQALPSYTTVSGISGNLNSIGSDTLNNLMAFWIEAFKNRYPNVVAGHEGKGSATAPPGLISGSSQLGPMSRLMKSKEIDDFEAKFGYKPTQIRVAVDALAVWVNKDNSIETLSLNQVDAIFSKSRRRGSHAIQVWGRLGLEGEWKEQPISLFGRNSASGTYGFFKEHVLKNGDYKDEVKEMPGSSAVAQAVAQDRFAIGYSGIGYAVANIRAVPLSEKAGGKAYPAVAEHAYSGDYPLSRFLFIYINKAPDKPLDPLIREFIRFVLSKEGQRIVVKDGFFPLPASISAEDARRAE